MIRKFIKIKNIGRFKDFSAAGNVILDKVNIIYGENSQGKTTLVAILKSLFQNNPNLIMERKTFGSNQEKQYVEVLLDENKGQIFRFKSNGWSAQLNSENIEIFDEFFVNENIYTGLEIQSDHQRCLFQFAVGKEGVSLAKEIEEMKKDLHSNKFPQLRDLEEQIKILMKNHFDVEAYVNLNKDKDIDSKIEEKKREISAAELSDEIKGKESLKEIQSISIPLDLDSVKAFLNKSLSTISKEALQRTKEHIDKLKSVLQKEAEVWLHKGLSVVEGIKDNKCPFCQQDLKYAIDTIQFYQQYFNQEYRELKGDVDSFYIQIREINIEQLLNDAKSTILENKGLVEFWKRFIDIEDFEFRNFDDYYQQMNRYFEEVKLAIFNKSQDILKPIPSECIDKFLQSIDTFNREVNNYNLRIQDINRQIEDLKNKQPNLENLKKALQRLEIMKQRFSAENDRLCERYRKLKREIEEKKELIEQKKESLNVNISQKLERYGEKTSQILEKFGAPFKIIKPNPRYRGRGQEPYFEYFIEIEECEINPLQKVRHTLSGGDKNALALAFFLAKIIVDEDIENKIIIFDDPISSFDYNRKRRTIEFIKFLSQKAKQIIILTHINTFAFELYDSLKNIGINPKCLQVINGEIKEWDINEDKKHPFFKNISKLEGFVSGQEEINLDEARRLIRICLEDKLKFNYFHFFKELGDECWLGTMIKRLRKFKDNQRLKFKYSDKEEVINELENLCDFSGPSHHSNIMSQYKTDYTRDEIVNYVNSTFKMIYEWL